MSDTPKVGDWLLYFSLWKGYQAIQITKITPQRLYGDFNYRKWISDNLAHGSSAYFSPDKERVIWLAAELNQLEAEKKVALAAVYDKYNERRALRYSKAKDVII